MAEIESIIRTIGAVAVIAGTVLDKLLIKPTAGARPASPCTPGRFIRKAHTKRPDA